MRLTQYQHQINLMRKPSRTVCCRADGQSRRPEQWLWNRSALDMQGGDPSRERTNRVSWLVQVLPGLLLLGAGSVLAPGEKGGERAWEGGGFSPFLFFFSKQVLFFFPSFFRLLLLLLPLSQPSCTLSGCSTDLVLRLGMICWLLIGRLSVLEMPAAS